MKTQREIETAVCESLVSFAQGYLRRRPNTIRAYLLNGLLVVRLQGVLNAAEQPTSEVDRVANRFFRSCVGGEH